MSKVYKKASNLQVLSTGSAPLFNLPDESAFLNYFCFSPFPELGCALPHPRSLIKHCPLEWVPLGRCFSCNPASLPGGPCIPSTGASPFLPRTSHYCFISYSASLLQPSRSNGENKYFQQLKGPCSYLSCILPISLSFSWPYSSSPLSRSSSCNISCSVSWIL